MNYTEAGAGSKTESHIVFTMPEPIINFGNGCTINLSNERWRDQGFRGAVAASSGSGKSYFVSVFHELLSDLGIPWILVDPYVEYTSLKDIGPSVSLAAIHHQADIKIRPYDADWAKAVMASLDKGGGVIITLDVHEEAKFEAYTHLMTSLFQHQHARRIAGHSCAMILTVEEAHLFAPQKRPKSKAALDISIEINQRGRKEGINTLFVTQRPHALDKEFLSQANIRWIGRLEESNDYKAVKDILPRTYSPGFYSSGKPKPQEPLNLLTLQSLPTGQFFLKIGADLRIFKRVRPRRTKDLGATPSFQPMLFQV